MNSDDTHRAEYSLVCEQPFVARGETACLHCRATIEVVCVYCERGMDLETGEPLERFTVSNIWAMDEALTRELERWAFFNAGMGGDTGQDHFANHCPHCGTMQDDYLLHSEPGDVFFALSRDAPGPVSFVPLAGPVQLGGDFSFEA